MLDLLEAGCSKEEEMDNIHSVPTMDDAFTPHRRRNRATLWGTQSVSRAPALPDHVVPHG